VAEQAEEMMEIPVATVANMEQNQSDLMSENKRLHEKMAELQRGKLIYSKMLAVKKDIGSVGKDQENTSQGWSFRGIDQFVNALHPILNKHGVGVSMDVKQNAETFQTAKLANGKERVTKNTRIIMEYTFFAEDGSSIKCSVPAEGVDPGDKGTNKALSAALKYCLIQTFFVPTEDMAEGDKDIVTVDGEAESKEPKQAKRTFARKASASAKKAEEQAPEAKKKRSFRKSMVKPASEEVEGVTEL